MMTTLILSTLFGKAKNPGLQLEVKVRGFYAGLYTGDKEGEYTISLRANGQNPQFPKQEDAKIFHFTKSDDRFNLVIPNRIAAAHNYSRIVVDIVSGEKQEEGQFGYRIPRSATPGLCLVVYTRDERGRERMYGGLNVGQIATVKDKVIAWDHPALKPKTIWP